jgi:hypothetical protein
MGKSITEITDEWKDKVNNATSGAADKVSGAVNEKVNNLFGGLTDSLASSGVGEMKKYHVNPVEFRSKLEVNCPDFLKQCNISKIDFGTLFLNDKAEQFISQATSITNDVINTINGIQNYISPAALEAVQNLITFIITDAVNTVVGYSTQVFLRYVSPEFPIGLATDITKATLSYTKDKTKTPDEILKEVCQSQNKSYEEVKEKSDKAARESVVGDIARISAEVVNWIKNAMDEIQPYTEIIGKYMLYGPDYACGEVAALYEKYVAMGISYVDEQIYKVEKMVHEYVDYAALTAGTWTAEKINNGQRRTAQKLVTSTDNATFAIVLKAKGLINKTIMNLLAILGG